MIAALSLLSKWKWIGVGVALLALGIYVQTLRLNVARSEASAKTAIAASIQHDLELISATNAANEELVHRTGTATAAAKADAAKAKKERDATAASFREALNMASKNDANLAACLALSLPDSLLNRIPWKTPSERDGL